MKNIKLRVFVIFIILILFGYTISNAATCDDVAKEDFEVDSTISGLPFNEKLADNLNPNDSSFISIYDFLVNGVDIDKLNDKQKEAYRKALKQTLNYMAAI